MTFLLYNVCIVMLNRGSEGNILKLIKILSLSFVYLDLIQDETAQVICEEPDINQREG